MLTYWSYCLNGWMQNAWSTGLTSVCCISNVLAIASTDEELDLRKECLKIRDVWHRELYKSGTQTRVTDQH